MRLHKAHLRRLRNTAIIGTALLLLFGVVGAIILIVVLESMTNEPVVVEILDVDPSPILWEVKA